MASKHVIAYYTAEALAVHALLDDLGVPRDSYGEPLSMSQRVDLLVRALPSSPFAA